MADQAKQKSLFQGLGDICYWGTQAKPETNRKSIAEGMQIVLKQLPDSILKQATVPELDQLLDRFLGIAGGHLKGRDIGAATMRICAVIEEKEAADKK